MNKDYLNELNDVQREAVVNINGPSLVIAGAGSGKTRVLTYRIAHLLNEGVPPYAILPLTFTNKAAREMKERIAALVGNDVAQRLWMGTFHSIFSRILRYEAEKLKHTSNFTIYDTQDSQSLIKKIVKEKKLDDKMYKPNEVLSRISKAKNNLVTAKTYLNTPQLQANDEAVQKPKIGEIYQEYEKRCFKADAMDFDDLLLKTNILFRDHPDVLAKYQHKFQYILVDEYQDTNFSQYLIVKKLALPQKNVCVVGDDAQSIYSFRGAKIENILNFKKDYPENRVYKLEQNYRSTQTIVNAANSLIAKNSKQLKKNSFSENETGEKISLVACSTDKEEGYRIANMITDSMYANQQMYRDYAILYRTNAQSRIFEESMRRNGLPYRIYGSVSFYQRKEIKDLMAYFKLTVNNNDEEAFRRVINYPTRGIGATTIAKLDAAANAKGISLWEVANGLASDSVGINLGTIKKVMAFVSMIKSFATKVETTSVYDLALEIATVSGVLTDLYNNKTPEGVSRSENIQELINGAKDFTENAEENEDKLNNYLESVSLLTDADTEGEGDDNKVTLMTIHSAKGLEFKNVYIVGMEEDLFPSKRTVSVIDDLEEERRLFYVALTRAEKSATISFAKIRFKWGDMTNTVPSRFISEIDQEYYDQPLEEIASVDPYENGDPDPDDFPFNRNSGYSKIERTPKKTFSRKNERPASFSAKSKKPLVNVEPPMSEKKLVKVSSPSGSNGNKSTQIGAFSVNMMVRHDKFGIGVIVALDGEAPNHSATIKFKDAGMKKLLLKFAKLQLVK